MSHKYRYEASTEALREKIERVAADISQRMQKGSGVEQFSFIDAIVHAVQDVGNDVVNATNDAVNQVAHVAQQAVNATAQGVDWAADHAQEVVEVTHAVAEVTEVAAQVAEAGAFNVAGQEQDAGGSGGAQASAARLIAARRKSIERNRRGLRDKIDAVREQILQAVEDARAKQARG